MKICIQGFVAYLLKIVRNSGRKEGGILSRKHVATFYRNFDSCMGQKNFTTLSGGRFHKYFLNYISFNYNVI